MDSLIAQVLSILTEPSGDLIYHLVQIFSALATLMLAIVSKRSREDRIYRRFMLGIIVVMASQLFLFLISTFGWRGLFDTHLILPVLDRVINVLCLSWIVWLWISPEPWKIADYALIGINIIIAILFIINFFTWLQAGPVMDFNSSWQDLNWANLSILIIIAGLVGLISKKPDGWGIGVGFLAINLTGYAAHLVLPTQSGDFSGIIRLVQVFTYPLIPVLTRRFPLIVETFLPAQKSVSPAMPYERTRFSAERRTLVSWIQLQSQERMDPFVRSLVKAVGQSMVADICMLLFPPDSQNQIVAQAGYDLIRQDLIPGVVIKGEALPEISKAFSQNQPLIMSVGGNLIKDLRTMRDVLGLKAPANILFVPISRDEKSLAGLLISSPYSTRLWDITDESFLLSLADEIAPLLQSINRKGSALVSADLASMDADTLREKYSQLTQEYQTQAKLVDDLQNKLSESPVNGSGMKTQFSGDADMSAQISYLERELRSSLDEITRLKKLGTTDSVQTGQEEGGSVPQKPQIDTPLLSAFLADIQKNLSILNRDIKALTSSNENLQTGSSVTAAITDIANKISTLSAFVDLDKAASLSAPQNINIHTLVDKFLLDNKEQFLEKSVSLKTEIPKKSELLELNSTLFQDIFSKLIGAALKCSPENGVIALSVDDHKISIKDSGSGLQQADLDQIFNPVPELNFNEIPGLGMDMAGILLVRSVLEKIGGHLQVTNNKEGGKTLILNFS